MQPFIPGISLWFTLCYTIFTLTNIIMVKQAHSFYTMLNGSRQKFSIMQLEWPKNRESLIALIKGIKQLPGTESTKVIAALKGQLYTDFVFMAAVYPGIFMLSMHTSYITGTIWASVFVCLAWLQALPWLLDITENIYLLHKIKQPLPSSPLVHAAYRLLEVCKWGISCVAAILSTIVSVYFLLRNPFHTWPHLCLSVILAETIAIIYFSKKYK